MPRIRRVNEPGIVQHVMNRGNRRMTIFGGSGDYLAFLGLLELATARFAVDLFAYCVMPNHWHQVVRARLPGEVSRYLRWLTGKCSLLPEMESVTFSRRIRLDGALRMAPR